MKQWIESLAAAIGMQPWTIQVFAVILGALLLDLVVRRVIDRVGRLASRTQQHWDDALVHAGKRPLSILIYGQGLLIAARILQPHTATVLFQLEWIGLVQQLLLVFVAAWFALRLVSGFEQAFIAHRRAAEIEFDITTVNVLARIVRIAIAVTAALTTLSILEIPISGLLAAGGVGGIALGLAARDLLANFFGGFMVFMDRPFSVGDWVRSPDRNIEGVVQKIGWRVTTIMKFDKRPMYVPNSVFTTITVENPSRMTNRRISEHVGVRYDDFAQVEAIVDAIREMLAEHPDLDPAQTTIVNFDRFGASSLDIMIYCFTRTVVWPEYHAVRQRVLLEIGRIIESHGAGIAFPTRTLKVDSWPASPATAGQSAANGDER